jgi:hypothetical protein
MIYNYFEWYNIIDIIWLFGYSISGSKPRRNFRTLNVRCQSVAELFTEAGKNTQSEKFWYAIALILKSLKTRFGALKTAPPSGRSNKFVRPKF